MSSHLQFDPQRGGSKPADIGLEQRDGADLQQLMHSNPQSSSEGFVLLCKDCIIRAPIVVYGHYFLRKYTFFPPSGFCHIAHLSHLHSLRFPCFSVAGWFHRLIYHNMKVECQRAKAVAFIFITNLH